jgi:dihydroceramide fatty acyl 2-hydroxylase
MKEYVRNQRGRMFESDFLEFFSKVHPAAPFVLWIPVVLGTISYALVTGLTDWRSAAVAVPLGVLSWQWMEYFIHKKLFHWQGIGPISRRFHDIVHGFHHKYPDDSDRLVMPLAVSISLGGLIGAGLTLLHRPDFTIPWWCGLVGGYVFYDFTHWSTHFRKPLTRWGKKMRAHHMAHHFADIDSNFGISHRYIDGLMGTLRKRSREERQHDDNGSITPASKA